ncbi:uncharacterized protein LOC141661498 isoform X1 [Apium graveolens]|uniref:uncharacterized protein LOC141661498 isoform X1 n=1 Tax=Apium graveolens TaxID=4045 RepID=UPI003D7C0317
MNRKQHVDIAIVNQSDQLKHNYRIQLAVAIDCVKLLLIQGLAFRGHDESETSRNRAAIESLLETYGLSITRIRGQGYDGASNMRGEFNGLKSLLLAENKSAHFVHCFAHQLQLTLVVVAKNHKKLGSFFNCIANLTNVVGGSCKCRDILREQRLAKVVEQLNSGELTTGRGLNQEILLKRAADTRCGSHYGVIVNLISMYPSVVNLLEYVENYGILSNQRSDANDLLDVIQYFEFGFLLHLMKNVLGITNELSQALQRKDQDLLNAMDLVKAAKIRFQNLRENGLVFNLLKLALTLPVATATVERAFSSMKIVKQSLRNRMGDRWLNDCLFTYIEKEIFVEVSTEEIIKQFQEMKTRRVAL